MRQSHLYLKPATAGTRNGLLCQYEGENLESSTEKKVYVYPTLGLDQQKVKCKKEITGAYRRLMKAMAQDRDLSPDAREARKTLLNRAKDEALAHFESLHRSRELKEFEERKRHDEVWLRAYKDTYYRYQFNLVDEASLHDYVATQWGALADLYQSLSDQASQLAKRFEPVSSNNLDINSTTFALIMLHHAIARRRFTQAGLKYVEGETSSSQNYRFSCVEETPLYCERAPNTFYFIKRQDKDAWGVIHYDDNLRATTTDSDAITGLTEALNTIRPEWMEWVGNQETASFYIACKIRDRLGPHFGANIPHILLDAPEVFADDLLLGREEEKFFEKCAGLFAGCLKNIFGKPLGLFDDLGNIKVLGEITPTGFYIDRYRAHTNSNTLGMGITDTGLCQSGYKVLHRVTSTGLYPIIKGFQHNKKQPNYKKTKPIGTCLTGNGKPVFDLVQWALASDIVDEHRQAIQTLSKTFDGLRYLVSKPNVSERIVLDKHLQSEDDIVVDKNVSPWAFNPRTCDPVLARLGLLDRFFNATTDDRYDSVTRRYLQQLDDTLIASIYKAIKRRRASKKSVDRVYVGQLDRLLEQIGTVIQGTLKQGFVNLPDSSILDEIKTLADVDQRNRMEDILQARTFDDAAIIQVLHRKLCVWLREYALQEANQCIFSLVESLKESFFKALRDDFAEVVSAGFTAARNEFIAAIKPLNDGVVKDNAVATLTAIDALACRTKKKKGSPTVCHLTEALREATYALEEAQQYGQASGERLMKYADQAYGKPGLGWKILGGVLITLGVLIAVAGILIANATLIPTGGLGALAGYGLAAAGGASLLTLGVGFFCHGRRQSLSKRLKQFAEPTNGHGGPLLG